MKHEKEKGQGSRDEKAQIQKATRKNRTLQKKLPENEYTKRKRPGWVSTVKVDERRRVWNLPLNSTVDFDSLDFDSRPQNGIEARLEKWGEDRLSWTQPLHIFILWETTNVMDGRKSRLGILQRTKMIS